MSEMNEAYRQQARAAAEKLPATMSPLDIAYSMHPDESIPADYTHEITPQEVDFDKQGWHVKPEVADRWGMTPHDPVNHPRHYTGGTIEVWDFIVDQNLNFPLGNVVKYVCRAGKKSDATYLEDLRKAEAYLQREMKRITDNAANH